MRPFDERRRCAWCGAVRYAIVRGVLVPFTLPCGCAARRAPGVRPLRADRKDAQDGTEGVGVPFPTRFENEPK